jgi:hypothetical protein
MPTRSLAKMTPEEIEEKVGALSPAWAKDYIRRLEGLTRALAAQLQAAQPAVDYAASYDPEASGNGQAPDLPVPPHPASSLSGRDIETALYALAQMWHAGYMDISLSAEEMETIGRVHDTWFQDGQAPVPLPSGAMPESAPAPGHFHAPDELGAATADQMRTHIANAHYGHQGLMGWDVTRVHAYHNGLHDGYAAGARITAGVTPPSGEYAIVRVVDGAANMDPIADLSDRAEVRFADFYQVHYGGHETTGGMRLLIVQGDGPVVIHPIGQDTVLISRGGHNQETR